MNRRSFLTGVATLVLASPARAGEAKPLALLRSSIDASHLGARPGAADDQSRTLQTAIELAAGRGRPLYIPPGRYVVSNLKLPDGARLVGVPGATELVYSGRGHLIFAENAERISLKGLTIDGTNRTLNEYAPSIAHFKGIKHLVIDDCDVVGSAMHGVALDRCGGRVERCRVSGAAEAGIRAIESSNLEIVRNTVKDCANGGILVHRYTPGDDGTMVQGNRVSNIAARNGGTGQWGNGINVFRANNVMVSGNRVDKCAFSAIRSNAGSNVQIMGNTCTRSGETAIYSEFGFEGAMIANNVVDGAANGITVCNFLQGGRMAVVSGNIVRNLDAPAPYQAEGQTFGNGIWVEAETTVTGNVIENAPRWGMVVGWGPYLRNVSATGNIIRKTRVGIAVTVVEGAKSAVISDNVIREAKDGAILGYRWHKRATEDLAKSGAGRWPHLSLLRNVTS